MPSFLAPILTFMLADDVGPEARNTSSRLITILTGWPALRDSASATGSRKTVVLPPKPPPISEAVTRRRETSMPSRLGADVAHHEVALGAHPQLAPAVGADAGQAGMGFDVALMRRLGLELVLDDDVGRGEALLDVAMAELVAAGDVGRPFAGSAASSRPCP